MINGQIQKLSQCIKKIREFSHIQKLDKIMSQGINYHIFLMEGLSKIRGAWIIKQLTVPCCTLYYYCLYRQVSVTLCRQFACWVADCRVRF